MILFDRPVFILSAPRSGSSFFYESIRRMYGTVSLERENDYSWHVFFPYSRSRLPSDFVDKSELNPELITLIKINLSWGKLLKPRLLKPHRGIKEILWKGWFLKKPIRYVEKTISNCFRLDVIEEIFPDALYIHLVRDGRANVSSMIEGWNSGVLSKRELPFPKNSSLSHWCYPVPPNWEKISCKSLEEICAWSWIEHNRYILEKHDSDSSFKERYLRISYENFLSDTTGVLSKVADFTNLNISKSCIDYSKSKQFSWTTVSPPKQDKWKEKNPDKIHRILPSIKPMMKKLGY